MGIKSQIKIISFLFILLMLSSTVFAYDEEGWKRLLNDNSEYIQYYERTFTLRIVFVGSIEKFRSEWFDVHGTVLKEKTFCMSVAGANTVPEIWIQVKEVNGEVWPNIVCFGHEILHIFKTLGLQVVNPNRNIK